MFVKAGILSSLPFFLFSCLNHFSPVLCPFSSSCKHLSCFGLHALGPKWCLWLLVYICPPTFSTSAPIHHHGDTSIPTSSYLQHGVPSPHPTAASLSKVPSSPIWGFIPTQGSVAICGP